MTITYVACTTPRGALRVRIARSFLARAGGLLIQPPLAADEALLIAPCSSIHTFGMGYPIDVVFIDRAGTVLKIAPAVGPARLRACRGAAATLELRGGAAATHGLVPQTVLQPLSEWLRR